MTRSWKRVEGSIDREESRRMPTEAIRGHHAQPLIHGVFFPMLAALIQRMAQCPDLALGPRMTEGGEVGFRGVRVWRFLEINRCDPLADFSHRRGSDSGTPGKCLSKQTFEE